MSDKSNELPWSERVNMLSINPDAADRDDVARLASELTAANTDIERRKDYESFLQGHDPSLPMECYAWWLKNKGLTSEYIK